MSIPNTDAYETVPSQLAALAGQIKAAPRIVFDLRGSLSTLDLGSYTFDQSGIGALLPTSPVVVPAQRRRMYSGFPPQGAGVAAWYFWRGAYDISGRTLYPSAGNRPRRFAFVINASTSVPDVAWAMQPTGEAVIVMDTAAGTLPAATPRTRVALGEGRYAEVRLADVVGEEGRGLTADTIVTENPEGTAVLDVALEMVRRPAGRQARKPPLIRTVARGEAAYAEMHYPSLPYRLLAAYRWWAAIRYFYPYKRFIGENWDSLLVASLRLVESARDSTEYELAIAEMVTHIHDSHGGVTGGALRQFFGTAQVGALVQYVERQPVVIRIADDSATVRSGIAVGDVVVRIDGEDVAARRSRLARYIAYSTPQALDAVIASRMLAGPEGSVARLVVRRADGALHELMVPRLPADRAPNMYAPRSGPVFHWLPGNVGYADLTRLSLAQVDSMFELFKDTKAIVFDDRGYPLGGEWAIASRLTERDGVIASRTIRPLVMSPDSEASATILNPLPRTAKWRYHGKTVLLVDERAISSAEDVGLDFEAANRTTLIGSPTMGADGSVTNVLLPGGLSARFTGEEQQHADGRQLQRVGLVPDIIVRPTIAGIRGGRDEVLERALKYLRTGR